MDFSTSDGSAVAGLDYVAVNGTLTFAPSVTSQPISVPIIGDTLAEPSETFFVQVFALRDKDSAERVMKTLTDKGLRVRLEREAEGGGGLYKIRVGGFETREEAEAMAVRLQKEGYPGAWVP